MGMAQQHDCRKSDGHERQAEDRAHDTHECDIHGHHHYEPDQVDAPHGRA